MTDDGVLIINGKEKYRDGVDNFHYNNTGDLMKIITGILISDSGFNEYQINGDGTWVESTVVVSGGILVIEPNLITVKLKFLMIRLLNFGKKLNSFLRYQEHLN